MRNDNLRSQAIKILNEHKKLVWPSISRYFKDPKYPISYLIPQKYKKDLNFYWKIVKDYPERQGKYLRPTLLLLTCEAMGTDTKKAIKTASAMQLSEDWLLIHDDLQDHSLVRRGKPTLHEIYGEELALNAGDTLHIIMWKILIDNKNILMNEKTFKIMNEFFSFLMRTAGGQASEIIWRERGNVITNKDWFFIVDGKTSYYTIAGPMRLGAIIAGANEKQLEAIAKFGSALGRCFQLVDDILDLTSTHKGSGHNIGSDIYEGKRTLILSRLLRNANTTDKNKVISIFLLYF